ncbi:unnamed protein product [Spirodela intermedia]|uniref:Uncharacterized protein n=1 Tax=Spirodela intermedia TaxID=51605 RepID=A0A7I8KYJ0_SPIIN|nr:unnamed protein product [Spirodela intermedia]
MVPFCRLFAFADALDVALMTVVPDTAAVGNGVALPLTTLFFGHLINAFGSSSGAGDVLHQVSEFVYVAVAAGVAAFLRSIGGRNVLCLAARLSHHLLFHRLLSNWAVGQKENDFSRALPSINITSEVTIVEPCQLDLLFLLFFIPKTPVLSSRHIVENLLHSGQVILSWLLQKMTHIANSKCQVWTNALSLVLDRDCILPCRSSPRSTVQEGLAASMGLGAVLLMIYSNYGLGTWYGGKLIVTGGGGYDGGTVVNVLIAIMTAGPSLGQVSPCVNAFPAGRAAAHRMFRTIERRRKVDGKVLVDGVDIRKLRLRWLRERISLVSQEPVLFSTTIRENVAYGRPDATAEEISAAVELANAVSFIDKIPEACRTNSFLHPASFFFLLGIDAMVGERRAQLSGGQKQRIAIARAILRSPRILLLDERLVQEALSRVMVGRTTIVAAHHLHTVRSADVIAVLRNGRIVEQGPHAELVRDPEGLYSRLIRLQDAEPPEKADDGGSPASGDSGSQRFPLSRCSSMGRSSQRIPLSRASSMGGSSQRFPVAVVSLPGNGGGDDQRLARLNKPELPVLLLGAAAAAVQGVVFPAFGVLFSSTIRIFFEPPPELRRQSRRVRPMPLREKTCKAPRSQHCLLGVVSLVAVPLKQYLFALAGGKLVIRIRSLSFQKVVNQEMSWFGDPSNSSGAIATRLSADAAAVRGLVGDSLALVVQNSATVAAGLVIAMAANWRLALIILALIPLVGLQGYVQMKILAGFSTEAKVKFEESTQVASDAVGGIRTVAAFCAEDKVMEAYDLRCRAPARQSLRQGVASGLGFGFSSLVLYCAYALIFYAGARFVQDGKATFGQVFRVFFALAMAAIGVSQTSAVGPDTNKARDSVASLFAILDRESKIDPGAAAGRTLTAVRGDVDFQHVSFSYPTRPDTVALVGESGSGKSTVLALLERFYDPTAGRILLDGQLALVSQEPALFNDTIHANIAYGGGGRGGDGGQRARLHLRPPGGVLDGGCSSSTSPPPRWTLRRSAPCRRRSTGVDAIAVLRNVEVVEMGTHAELLQVPGGAYASLLAIHLSPPPSIPQ